MKIYFDIDLVSGTRYGMTIATVELMKALQKDGVEVINFAAGRPKHISEHMAYMKSEGFKVLVCPIPRKILGILNKFGICIETLFLGRYDYFIQIGLHMLRHIPKKKYIISIHDTVGLRYPKEEQPFPVNSQQMVNKAGMILTVSEFSKNEIIHFFKIKADSVIVIPNGCDLKRFRIYDREMIQKVMEKYSLPDTYFITYGGKSARKNINFLLESYEKWSDKDKPGLVIFGHKIERNIAGVYPLGYIPDEDVALILSGAKALVFPTYYEGFGLPILEAFACAVPVICSKASSLPEVTQGNAVFFNPVDKEDLIKKLSEFIEDMKGHKALIDKGLEIAQNSSWEKAASQLKRILEKIS
ncbi:MAG: hypothetical protein A2Y40_05325 [Candidatus Margulisbacteria bacterium GWF2_35_9]|nr:MAG: hypothetical protein A2Y40_05325 [Candidatus Margulisbacteria bacterium GWF2_35_9]